MFTVYLAMFVIALCSIGMAMTYVNEALQNSGFFGDVKLTVPIDTTYSSDLDKWHIWGARHYWYFWMCIVLFLLSVVRIIIWAFYYCEKHFTY